MDTNDPARVSAETARPPALSAHLTSAVKSPVTSRSEGGPHYRKRNRNNDFRWCGIIGRVALQNPGNHR